MKQIFTLFMVMFIGLNLAEAQTIYYYQDFSMGMPASYKTYDVDNLTPNITAFATKGKGWVVYQGRAASTSWYTTAGTANDWMVTESIQVPAAVNPDNRVQLVWSEQTSSASYPDGYKVYVSEKGQAVADFTTELLTVTPAQAAAFAATGTLRAVDLTAYAGKTVYFAFRNNTFDGEALFIDDIALVELTKNEMRSNEVTNKIYNKAGNITVSGTMVNLGWEKVTSFDFNYSIDNGPVTKGTVTNASIGALATGEYSCTIPWSGTGSQQHEIAIWPTNINGNSDGEAEGDTSTLKVYVYSPSDIIGRTTVLESFSSSTCPPCAPGNVVIQNVVASLTEKPIQLKYQQDFPGTGDPYNTVETLNRRYYYGINAIPDTRIDGDFLALNPNSLVAKNITDAQLRPGLVSFAAKYEIDAANQSIKVYGTWTPTVDMMDNNWFMLAIAEKLTSKNKTTNGETEFHHVVKKLYPDFGGTNVTGILANEPQAFEFTYTFPGKYRLPATGQAANVIDLSTEHSVEEFDDLEAIMWVENGRDQFILNAYAAEFTTSSNQISSIQKFRVYPNPSSQFANVAINVNEPLNGQLIVTDVLGKTIWSTNQNVTVGENIINIPVVSQLAPGTYNVIFKSGFKVATQELIVK
ncbi:MAG: choice-of-anchor J domain-containing protein [Saprospiraceae bacterium]|jgi:hypothetical protein|nr:choice-of-anchor J domain-containing protein [Saprospiraceae bacterium]